MAGTTVIKSISAKIDQLIADNRRLRESERKTLSRYDRLRQQNSVLSARISELEMKLAATELKEAVEGGSGDTKLARARINRLMREVDKCIALLNR